MSDVLISIGISSEAAKTGRDQIIGYNADIAASYDKVLAASKAAGSQNAGAGLQPLREQKAAVDDLARTYDRAAAEIMAGDVRRMASAKALADAGDRAAAALMLADQHRAKEAEKLSASQIATAEKAAAAVMASEMQRADAAERAAQRIRDAQASQNAQFMRTDAAAQSFAGFTRSGLSAKDSASVFASHFAEEARALEVREKAAVAVMEADMRRDAVAQKAASDDISAADRAAAAIMASDQRKAQAAQKSAADQERAVARLTGTYTPYAAELQRLAKDEALINELRSSGTKDTAWATQALTALHARQAAVTAESERMANGAKLSANQMRNLSYQINDVVSGLAMGQSPFMILTQQGGQFVQIAQDAGIGLGGVALGIAGVVAAATAIVVPIAHLASMNQEAKTLDITLRSVGNTANSAGAKLQELAAQTARFSMSSREDITASFSAITSDQVGRGLSPAQIQKLTLAAEGYAAVTGKTLPEATNALMKAVSGGFDGMVKLSAQFPLATAAELDNLRAMSQHGDVAGMLALQIQLLDRKFSSLATQGASESSKAIHGLSTAWDDFLTKVSHSDIVVGALDEITNTVRGLSDEIRNAPAALIALLNPSTQLLELAKLNAQGRYRSPVLSLPMPPPLANGKQTDGVGGTIGEGGNASENDAFTAKTNAVMAAAQAQAAAYNLVGVARQRAMVSAQYDAQIVSAGADMAKVSEAQAQKKAALLLVDAQAHGQTAETIDDLARQTKAQQELNSAIGRGYEARARSEQENAVAAAKRQNPGMTSAEEAELRRQLSRAAEAKRVSAEFTDLDALKQSAANENALADARLRGADALRKANIEIETQKRIKQYGGNEPDIRAALEAESIAKQRTELAQQAIANSATLSAQQQANDLDLIIAKMRELGATSEEIAQVYQNAEIAKLEATQNWADGAKAAMMRYSQTASNYGAMAGRVVTNGMQSMENAIVGFSSKTMTAAQAFKSMATSIIQDLIRMQVQANITGPLSRALSSGIGDFFSSGPQQLASANSSISSYPGMSEAFSGAFASGTDYAPGGLSLVGEEGPELMQLPGGARIYPADETQAILSPRAANSNTQGSGGNVVQITNYVEAGASMADVEAAVASGIQQAAPHIVNAAVQKSVPASVGAVRDAANRGGSFAQAVGRR